MKAIIDTHTFLWWITDSPNLSSQARTFMAAGANDLYLSVASGWEMAIKARLGRLQIVDDLERFVGAQMLANQIQSIPILMTHALRVFMLPDHHRDPFDRLIIAQAQLEKLPILTADANIAKYEVEVIW